MTLCFLKGIPAFVMMNRYPYNSGHLMIVPFRHICEMEDLLPEEKREIFDLLDMSIKILKKAMNPEGFNVGINLGKAAGAGIDRSYACAHRAKMVRGHELHNRCGRYTCYPRRHIQDV